MTLYRKLGGISFFLVLSLASISQTAQPKTLLWRISGHGLQKPSYLYGTMHLNDKRLFMFGDSVYQAIEQSEGLAIEVNPDEMGAYYINQLFDQLENSKKLADILKDKDYKKYSAALAKKFKKPATEITARDLVKEKNKWMNDYMEKGEMPTFVDAYLYNIARRQGKWLGGIEDITDQAGLLEDMIDKSDIDNMLAGESAASSKARNEGLDKMIELYSNQDIEGIEYITNGQSTQDQKDRLLINRNIKMARRMDSLAHLRTMFLAVGAAHLPGDSGVIYLLRKRGFSVEPVFSSKKLDAKDYTFKEVHLPWFPVTDNQGMYQASMPGNPATVKLFGVMEMKFLLDIFNMSGYCSMAFLSPAGFTNKDSIYNGMAMRMFQAEKAPPSKIIHANGIEGREFIQVKKGANIRAQVFLHNKSVYCFFMYSMKEAGMTSEDANHFFSSFTINTNKSFSSQPIVFTDSIMGISCELPATLSYNKKLSNNSDEGWKITTYTGTDLSSGSYIMIFSKEVKSSHYVPTDSVVFNDFNDNIKKQYTDFQLQEKVLQGNRMVKLIGKNLEQPDLYMTSLNILQNGRNILLLAITDSAHLHSQATERIFESFRLVPHPAVEWKSRSDANNRFSSEAPAAFQSYVSKVSNEEQFCAYDTTTAISYMVIPDTLGKYFWAKDDSSFWKNRVRDNLGDDSLLQQSPVANGELTGIELLSIPPKNASRFKRMRLLQDGDKLYKLFVSAEKDILYSPQANSFFSSFRIHKPSGNKNFISSSKASLLLADLLSADSATRRNADAAIYRAPFTEEDREILQQAVFKKYASPYYTTESTSSNYTIANKLALLKSAATVDFIKNAYGTFSERTDTLKNIALAVLAKINSRESYTALAALLQQSRPRQPFNYAFTEGLRDSLALTAEIYPVLQQMAADTIHATRIAEIANGLVDSGFLKMPAIKPAEKDFIHAAGQLLPTLLHNELPDYHIYSLITLLGRFKDAAANSMLNSYLGVKSLYLRKSAALQLLGNAQPVPPAVFTAMAADKSIRHTLYTDLADVKKKSLFPARYLNQASFAESAMYQAASNEDDDEEPAAMIFLQTKTAVYKKKTYIFYLYKVSYDGEEPAEFLGIAGGYAVTGKGLEPVSELSGIYRERPFEAKQINSLLKAYLASLEKEQENTTDE